MEAWVKILAGLCFVFLSLSYLYRPGWILRFNTLGRALFFNDSYVLLYRRRWGLLLFLCAILFFYSGFNNLALMMAQGRASSYLQLADAYRSFHAQQYKGTVVRCQEILKRESDNIYAWTLLGAAWSALGRADQARRAWEQVLKLDPDRPLGRISPLESPAKSENRRR